MTSADKTIEMLTPERRKEIERIAMKASQLYCNDTVAGEAVVAIKDLLTELTRLTEKCEAPEMTEERAREILKITGTSDYYLSQPISSDITIRFGDGIHGRYVTGLPNPTPDQLEAIAYWMRRKG